MGSRADHLRTTRIERVCDDSFLLAVRNDDDGAAAFGDAFRRHRGREAIDDVRVAAIARRRQVVADSRTTREDEGSVA
jgi:hypothetical protein